MPRTIGMEPQASSPVRLNGFGIASLALGFLGWLFFFLAPFGAVLAAGGVVTGLIGWLFPGARTRPGLAVAGTVLSVLALAFDVFLLAGGVTHVWANRY